jgi:NADH dehydrogenase
VSVNPDLTVPNHPEIMVIGDLANFSHQTGSPLPGVAPVAMQQGRYAAKRIRNQMQGRETSPFRYVDRGTLATIGRSAAVADFGKLRFSGWFAWVLWLFIHLLFLIQFRNRVLVVFQWAWSYLTRNRSTRLIVEHRGSSDSNHP